MAIPVFILAGQSNASGLSYEIETALEDRYGADNYELLSVFSPGAPLTREREDRPDWSDPTEMREELTTGMINALNEDPDHVIGGMIWIQGEADTYYTAGATRYGDELETLIDDLRDDVADAMGDRETGLDVAPVTILELSDNAPAASERAAWDRVISEQRDVAEADPLITTLDPDAVAEDADIPPAAMFEDDLHYQDGFQFLLADELVETMSPPISFGIGEEDMPSETPIVDPVAPADDPQEPVEEPTPTVPEPDMPTAEPNPPVVEPDVIVAEPDIPTAEPNFPAVEPDAPSDEPIIPVVERFAPELEEENNTFDAFEDDGGFGDLAWIFAFLPFIGLLG